MGKLEAWDFVAVAAYFVAVIATGVYAMCRSNRGTVSGYFLAGRYMTWLPVGASLFASNIGSEHFIGLAGSGAAAGIAVGAFELNACVLLQLLGWVFFPVYVASAVTTLPEYMKRRFGGKRIQIYLTTLSLVLYIFTKISVNLYSGALFIQQALEWDIYLSVLLILAATAFCTVTGGLAAVIYTDTLQAFVMMAGGIILAVMSMVKIGGYKNLYYGYLAAIPNTTLANPNTTCGYPRNDSWNMLRDPIDSDMPWPGFLFGQTPASIWYWCADQMMVQRVLAAKSLSHAQGGTLFAGYAKLMIPFIMVMPGMVSRTLFPNEVGCADPDVCEAVCQNRVSCSNIAYPKLVLELLPTGLKGLMMSVMLAALMSNLTSIFNSASTLFTMDLYRYMRKKASTRELMIVGRVFVCVMVVLSIIWIPVIANMQGGQLYIYIQAIAAYLSPPIAAVYLIAVLWKRGNEQGAFWGMLIGMIVGVFRMALDFIFREPNCGEVDTRPRVVAILSIHYMYFAMMLVILTSVVNVTISLLTTPPTQQQITRTTFWTRKDPLFPTTTLQSNEHQYEQVKRNCDEDSTLCSTNASGEGLEHSASNNDSKADNARLSNGFVGARYEKGGANGDVTQDSGKDTEQILVQFKETKPVIVRQYSQTKEPGCWDKIQGTCPHLCMALDWFCGFNDNEQSLKINQQQVEREEELANLHQDPRAKISLIVAMIVLNTLADWKDEERKDQFLFGEKHWCMVS